MNFTRLEALEARLNPRPEVVVVLYREAGEEDSPLTEQESELYRLLLEEALASAPDARGVTLFLDPSNPHWKAWEASEGL